MTIYSSILAWRIPWTEEPGGLQSIVSPRLGHNWSDLARRQRYVLIHFFIQQTLTEHFPYANPWANLSQLGGKICSMWVKVKLLSHVRLLTTLWIAAHQAPLSMGFSRKEYQGGLPCLPPGDLPDQGFNLQLLHCKWILYHWANGESVFTVPTFKFSLLDLRGWYSAPHHRRIQLISLFIKVKFFCFIYLLC